MTNQHDRTCGSGWLSRRRLLRAAGIGAGGLALGAAVAPAPVSATDCPRSKRYWSRTEWPASFTDGRSELELGGMTKLIANWKLFLGVAPGEDRSVSLAQHLLAAMLNLELRPVSDPDCSDRPLTSVGGRTIEGVKNTALRWLHWSSFAETDEVQDSWLVDANGETIDGEPLRDALAEFNANALSQLNCGCRGVDPDLDASGDDTGTSGSHADTSVGTSIHLRR